MLRYVTFTKYDKHIVKGIKFNHHCVAKVEGKDDDECKQIIDRAFGGSYRFDYTKDEINLERELRQCSRGLVEVPHGV